MPLLLLSSQALVPPSLCLTHIHQAPPSFLRFFKLRSQPMALSTQPQGGAWIHLSTKMCRIYIDMQTEGLKLLLPPWSKWLNIRSPMDLTRLLLMTARLRPWCIPLQLASSTLSQTYFQKRCSFVTCPSTFRTTTTLAAMPSETRSMQESDWWL